MTGKRRQAFSTKRMLVSSNYILTGTEDDERRKPSKE
jgi:hypothetical protein